MTDRGQNNDNTAENSYIVLTYNLERRWVADW